MKHLTVQAPAGLAQWLQRSETRTILEAMLQASNAAAERGGDAWRFSLDLQAVRRGGLTDTLIRLLIEDGALLQRIETTPLSAAVRTFEAVENLSLQGRCCLMISSAGAALVKTILTEREADLGQGQEDTAAQAIRPCWEPWANKVTYRGQLVRRVRADAKHVRALLTALEEEAWPATGIDDPLPPNAHRDSREVLKETVDYLNTRQQDVRIQFRLAACRTRVLYRVLDLNAPSG